MIEFEKKIGSEILPISECEKIPSKEEVKKFFEHNFKANVDEFLIYKKNQFKNPNREILNDFIAKLENFIKEQNGDENLRVCINLIFDNMSNSLKLLEDRKCLPDNKKILAFFVSFIVSKFFN